MDTRAIEENCRRLRDEIPDYVTMVVAAKTRQPDEIKAAIGAGITDFGENYVQEAQDMRAALAGAAGTVRWHMIGHLQTNKVKKALDLFQMIQTLDSLKLARALDQRAEREVPVLIEVNSGREPQKTGVLPEKAEALIRDIAQLRRVQIKGLMTMGPRFGDPERARPYFQTMKVLYDRLVSLDIPSVEMGILSMGMSNTYRIAIEEGSNMIRPGTIIFGEREG